MTKIYAPHRILPVVLGLHFLIYSLVGAAVTLPKIFGENMVLQCEKEIPIWGWAAPGEQISVKFANLEKSVTADSLGTWQVKFPALPANATGQDLLVQGKNQVRLQNVLLGEVWLCSGQSNMEYSLLSLGQRILNAEAEVASANYPTLRLLTVQTQPAFAPAADIETKGWQVCSPETIIDFSAVAYFFGRKLLEELKTPVGLISATRGGTPAEAWTSPLALKTLPDFAPVLQMLPGQIEQAKKSVIINKNLARAWFDALNQIDPGFSKNQPLWAGIQFGDDDWSEMQVPGTWENFGFPDFDGAVWFRKEIELPETWTGQPLRLSLPGINDMHHAFFNGHAIGGFEETRGWTTPRIYEIPAKIIRPGKNVIAVRAIDLAFSGGICGLPQDLWLEADSQRISLVGTWKFKPAVPLANLAPFPRPTEDILNNPTLPGVLFNGMIQPLIPFAFRGVIWYQGEANVNRPEQYRTLFPTLIRDWRGWWRSGDFPFLFVQIASFQGNFPTGDDQLPRLREAQQAALALANTGMAVTLDIGESQNIHPLNKQDVGLRLALPALKLAYQRDLVFSGPVYQNFFREGRRLRVIFKHTGSGLMAGKKDGLAPVVKIKNGKLREFEIAGPDGKWFPAEAKIEGHSVIVWHVQVPLPVAVRYAFSADPKQCNFYNREGLPAAPFRSDCPK